MYNIFTNVKKTKEDIIESLKRVWGPSKRPWILEDTGPHTHLRLNGLRPRGMWCLGEMCVCFISSEIQIHQFWRM